MPVSSDSEYECERAEFEAAQAMKRAERRKKKEAEERAEKAWKNAAAEAEATEK